MKHLITWVMVLAGVLMGQQIANAASGSEPSHFWGGVNLKYWMSSYNPSEGFGTTKVGQVSPSFVIGYDRFFYTLTFPLQPTITNNAYPAGGIKLQEQSFGVGYNFSSNFALVIGKKSFAELYNGTTNNTTYNTVAAVFNWAVPDSKTILFGNIGIGQGKSQNYVQAQNSYKYSGYELGVSYPVYTSTKASLGYKSEKMELPFGVAGMLGTAKKSGLIAGISYLF